MEEGKKPLKKAKKAVNTKNDKKAQINNQVRTVQFHRSYGFENELRCGLALLTTKLFAYSPTDNSIARKI